MIFIFLFVGFWIAPNFDSKKYIYVLVSEKKSLKVILKQALSFKIKKNKISYFGYHRYSTPWHS